jgi:hypothetical protein
MAMARKAVLFVSLSDLVEGLIRLMNGKHTGPMNIGNPWMNSRFGSLAESSSSKQSILIFL